MNSSTKPYFYERDPGGALPWIWTVKRRNRVEGANTIARCIFSNDAVLIVEALNKTTDLELPAKGSPNAARRG